MASILNADNGVVSGSAGLKSNADSSGVLELQTNGTTAVTVNTNQSVSLTAGTANGVTYLNGSKVLTSGSALTFDGSNTFLFNASAAGSQANFRVQTDTTGAVANGYFNINGTDYFRIYTTSSETGLRNLQNTPMYFSVNNTEGMRLTSTGLGIGTSTPAYKVDAVRTGTGDVAKFTKSGGQSGYIYADSAGAGFFTGAGATGAGMYAYTGGLEFSTNSTVKATLDNSGNLGLGVTPSAWISGVKALDMAQAAYVGGSGGGGFIDGNSYIDSGNTARYKTTNSATRYNFQGGIHAWSIAPSGTAGNAISFTQAMTLDASGRQLLGHTSSQGNNSRLQVSGSAEFFGSQGGNGPLTTLSFYNTNSSGFQIATMDVITGANFYEGIIRWQTKDAGGTVAERVRIDSSGNLLVGTTSNGGNGLSIKPQASAGSTTQINFNRTSSSTTGYPIVFQNGGTDVGYISYNNTTTAYVTSSDYRLKNTIAPMTGALAKVALLKPCTYKWNADGSDGEGFIAHELAEVCPHAVTGEKDAVDEDGNPKYQGIDTSFLVATLTAALQEQQAIIESLKARLDAANL